MHLDKIPRAPNFMTMGAPKSKSRGVQDWSGRTFAAGLGRGFAGAIIFALPMFMTMEMWELGFYMDRWRLLFLLLLTLPLLVLLSDRVGFEETSTWSDAGRDAATAFAIGILSSAAILFAVGVLKIGQPFHEMTGKVAVQSVPASIGALLGRSQLNSERETGGDEDPLQNSPAGYAGELFLMGLGALFLGLNVAPTEEMILLSFKMSSWHVLAVIAISLVVMHGFVYAVSFKGGHEIGDDVPAWHIAIRFTLPGYLIALCVSAFCLWTFERFSGTSFWPMISTVVVLGLPCSIGAAAARLIL